ncbi:MAG: glutathione S-transferase family protein [Cyanobacteria bacterium P01_H01_bin.15]
MRLLQFSTSHYCRKVRLALGWKGLTYEVKNLTPGLHRLQLKPLTGLATVPVLVVDDGEAIGETTRILRYLEKLAGPPLLPNNDIDRQRAELLEDWLDESIGTAVRFVYYDFRAGPGKSIDASVMSQLVIQVVRWQYAITPPAVAIAKERLEQALKTLAYWQDQDFLVGDHLSVADVTVAGLLSPLALIPDYRDRYPWLFQKIQGIHELCGETLPPGLA